MNESHSTTPVQLLCFLDLLREIRLMVHELVFGVDQRIQIDRGLTKDTKNFGTFPVRFLKF